MTDIKVACSLHGDLTLSHERLEMTSAFNTEGKETQTYTFICPVDGEIVEKFLDPEVPDTGSSRWELLTAAGVHSKIYFVPTEAPHNGDEGYVA